MLKERISIELINALDAINGLTMALIYFSRFCEKSYWLFMHELQLSVSDVMLW